MASEAYFKKHAEDEAKRRGIDLANIPKSPSNITTESVTQNVHDLNAQAKDERMKFIFRSLIDHLHDFIRQTSISTEEWMTAIQFLTDTGKISTDIRQEFILLSDVLGVSALVGCINGHRPTGAMESTVLGPFFVEDGPKVEHGESISSEGKGDYMYVEGKVQDLAGNPIAGAIIDTWETDGDGRYDTQINDGAQLDCRGRLFSQDDGSYAYRATVPVPYAIPEDGPVAKLVEKLDRHPVRPAHLHLQVQAPGYDTLVTAVYFKGDSFNTSDPVFGVKSSLIIEPEIISDASLSKSRGFKDGSKPHVYIKQDIVLATVEQAADAREKAKPKSDAKN